MAYYIMALAELNRRVNPDDSMPAPDPSVPFPSADASPDFDIGPH